MRSSPVFSSGFIVPPATLFCNRLLAEFLLNPVKKLPAGERKSPFTQKKD
jgi:hypothetical protein